MDPTPDNLKTLSNYLKQTMSPDAGIRKPAEEFLRQHECQRGFALLLLTLLGSEDTSPDMMYVKIAAAINFKNYIKRNWKIVSFKFILKKYSDINLSINCEIFSL